MTIAPSSDIVLGVALAADPEKYRAAAQRLQRLDSTAATANDVAPWQASTTFNGQEPGSVPLTPGRLASSPARARTKPDAFGQLEAFVLQTFIQSMLPKNATHVFGKGTAGEMWKSMLAEKLAGEIAGSGQVGIAKRLQSAAVAAGTITGVPGAATIPASPALASVLPYLQPASTAAPETERENS